MQRSEIPLAKQIADGRSKKEQTSVLLEANAVESLVKCVRVALQQPKFRSSVVATAEKNRLLVARSDDRLRDHLTLYATEPSLWTIPLPFGWTLIRKTSESFDCLQKFEEATKNAVDWENRDRVQRLATRVEQSLGPVFAKELMDLSVWFKSNRICLHFKLLPDGRKIG